jgi:pimeloyl-ACP methyl ester carboxylesterase
VRREPEGQSASPAHVSDDFLRRLAEIADSERNRDAASAFAGVRPEFRVALDDLRRRTLAQVAERGVPVPTLVVWGADDPSAPVELATQLFDVLRGRAPRAELHVFDRAGHYSFREHPEAFNALVGAFVAGAG